MNLIYTHPKSGGELYQSGYREIPWDLKKKEIHRVIFAAVECPPLSHHSGAHLLHVPLDDKQKMSVKEYVFTVTAAMSIASQLAIDILKGRKVITSCNAGLNRSGLLSAMTLKTITDLSDDDIVSLIRQKRHQAALCNSTFESMLKHYVKVN